tara:strand:+ start:262 stop:672 length:411 start_codon:yes stop_codon:yes gene_type:complete
MTPVLYILMRTDLDSMNPGKAMAQASHASNAFVYLAEVGGWEQVDPTWKLFQTWTDQTRQGFGTVLVLGVNEIQMKTAVDISHSLNYISEVVNDPTYPLQDGDTTHFIPLDTCGFIFGDKEDPVLQSIVGNFELHT